MSKNKRQNVIGIAVGFFVLSILILFFPGCGEDTQLPSPKKETAENKVDKVGKTVKSKEKKQSKFIEKKEFYPTGEVKAVYSVYRKKPEIRHGKYVGYYKNGERKMEYTYKNNIKEGSLLFWYKGRKKALEGRFVNDRREGKFKEYHPNGNLKLTYGYKNGLLEGLWIEFYNDGKTKMIKKSFKNGKLDGLFFQYTIEGVVKEQIYYKDGQIVKSADAEK